METAIVVPVEGAELLLAAAATVFGFDRPSGVPAHVTLLYPFVDAERLVVGHAHEAQRALSDVQPFECSFSSIGRFDDPPVAIYLEPKPVEQFSAMIEALIAAFPKFPPYGGAVDEVVPHLTIVETADRNLWAEIEEWVRPQLPVRTSVQGFSIYAQSDTGWVERFKLPLRSAAS
jgi:2'-5' RNA ligase superfamily